MHKAATQKQVRIFPDGAAIARYAAQKFVEIAADAVAQKGSFEVALSGGSTPKTLYSLLVTDPALRARLPWDKMFVFFGDERHVGPDDALSNFRMASEAMISKSPLQPAHVFRVKGDIRKPNKRHSSTNATFARISNCPTRNSRASILCFSAWARKDTLLPCSPEPKPCTKLGASQCIIG